MEAYDGIADLTKDELLVAIYGVWHVWKERYRRVFQHSSLSAAQVLELIKDDLLGPILLPAAIFRGCM